MANVGTSTTEHPAALRGAEASSLAEELDAMRSRWKAVAPVQADDGTWHDPSSTAPTSFYDTYRAWKDFDFDGFLASRTKADVLRSLGAERKGPLDFLTLISPAAAVPELLELVAERAHVVSERRFGRTISLFTPLYLANVCDNGCVYCGFSRHNRVPRAILRPNEIAREGDAIAREGIHHVIILTGESRRATPPAYIAEAASILKNRIDSICVEVYSLTQDEYQMLARAGVDGFTMFQETYNEDIYPNLHPIGPKHDYRWRLDTPERAARAGLHSVGIGALLGLDDWHRDAFFTQLHARYLIERYPGCDIAASLPRIRPCAGQVSFHIHHPVDDTSIVQTMVALRVCLPRLGITVSTRETPEFRDAIIGLGVTKMSAGSITEVGGHADTAKTEGQFETSDARDVAQFCAAVRSHGYQPIYKDWESLARQAS